MAIGAVAASVPIALICTFYAQYQSGFGLWQGLSYYSLFGTSVLTALMAAASFDSENADF